MPANTKIWIVKVKGYPDNIHFDQRMGTIGELPANEQEFMERALIYADEVDGKSRRKGDGWIHALKPKNWLKSITNWLHR